MSIVIFHVVLKRVREYNLFDVKPQTYRAQGENQ